MEKKHCLANKIMTMSCNSINGFMNKVNLRQSQPTEFKGQSVKIIQISRQSIIGSHEIKQIRST